MRKQKQKKRKNSISQPEQELYHSQNFAANRKKSLSLRQIKQNYSTLPPNPEHNLHHPKTTLLNKLSQQLKNKLSTDIYTTKAIQTEDLTKIGRLRKIQKELQRINEENNQKIKQLTEMQTTFLKKLQKDMRKDKEIQEKLLHEYDLLMKEDQKVFLTREVKKIKDKEDWVMIQQQQRRLEMLVRAFQQRQHEMARDKSTEPKTKRKKEIEEDLDQDKQKGKGNKNKERKKKNAEELKEIGRQFLEHAKKVQAQKLKENTKLLDVYKKSIDYIPQIKSILKFKGIDLSHPTDLDQSVTKLKKRRNSPVKVIKKF